MKTPKKYTFSRRLDKAVTAAETVLGPKAVKRLIVGLVHGFEAPTSQVDAESVELLAKMFSLVDPKKQVIIETGAPVPGSVAVYDTSKGRSITDKCEGFTLVDLRASLAEDLSEDPTGVILEAIQLIAGRELTLAEAEKINITINQITQLIRSKKNVNRKKDN